LASMASSFLGTSPRLKHRAFASAYSATPPSAEAGRPDR